MVITGVTCMLCSEVFLTSEDFNQHLETHVVKMPPVTDTSSLMSTMTPNPMIKKLPSLNFYEQMPLDLNLSETIKNQDEDKSVINQVELFNLPKYGEDLLNLKLESVTSPKGEDKPPICTSNDASVSEPSVQVPLDIKTQDEVKSVTNHVFNLPKNESNQYSCEICKKIFPTRSKLKKHKLVHDPNKEKVECPICLRKVNPRWYQNHKNIHKNVDKELFKCDLCAKPFGLAKHLNIHKQHLYCKNYRYMCDKCGRKFQYKASLLMHDANKHQDTPGECSICKKSSKTGTSQLKHHRCHDPRFRKIQCPVCLKVLAPRTVKIHEAMHAVGNKESTICDVCGKTIAYRSRLKLHMRTHTGEKPYPCDKCGKCFSNSSTLVEHKRTHTNERPYVCKVCNRGFTQRTPLRVHMRCHTGERPYKCHICSKGFITRGLLKGHKCRGPS